MGMNLTGAMTAELTMLFWAVMLYFLLIMIPAALGIRDNGAKAQGGPRDDMPEPSVLRARMNRLAGNMQENMVLFTALVLVAHAAGVHSDNTVLGAEIFVGARVAHAVIYIAGWPMIRPVAWLISVIGMAMIAVEMM